MADGAQPAGGGDWLAAAPPNFRPQVIQTIVRNLAGIYRCQLSQLHGVAAKFEVTVLRESNSMQDYLRRIGRKMFELQQKRQSVVQAASYLQQQAQTVSTMQPTNAVQVNSSVAAMSRTASTMSVPGMPPRLQNMQMKVEQEQPSTLAPMAQAVQLQPRQPTVVTQIQTQCPARQLQPTTFAGCDLTSEAQLQWQPIVRPNAQQNHLRKQNASAICKQQPQRVNEQQRCQTHGAQQANVAVMQIGLPGGQNNQQFGSPRTSATNGSAGEVDWREDMFQNITSLKDAYFSELAEFDRAIVLPTKTKEQLESLSKEQADRYRSTYKLKEKIRNVLNFLQLQKSNIPEGMKGLFGRYQMAPLNLLHIYREMKAQSTERNAGRPPQNCRGPPPTINPTGGTTSQQKQHEQPAVQSISKSTQDTEARTPPALQQNHSDRFVVQAEDDEVRRGAEAPVAINLTSDTSPCSQEKQQEQPADERIPELTQSIPAGTPPVQQQNDSAHPVGQAADDEVRGGAEGQVDTETLIARGVDAARSLSPAARRSLASDMGVNLKRAFRHTTSGSCVPFEHDAWQSGSSGESSYKRRRTHNGALQAEIGAAYSMLFDTVIGVTGDGGEHGSTVIEFRYNVVSLAPDLLSVFDAPEISTKLLVPADYPRSSPALLDNGEPRNGIPGAVDVAFRRALGEPPEPKSIVEAARTWESCVRRVVVDFAHRYGGGTFSSSYGRWESCVGV